MHLADFLVYNIECRLSVRKMQIIASYESFVLNTILLRGIHV